MHETSTCTPVPDFDETTGYLYLVGDDKYGVTKRSVVARLDAEGNILVWWKVGKQEYPLTLEQIIDWMGLLETE